MSTAKFNTHKSLSSSADLVTLLCRFEGTDFVFICFVFTYLFISKEAGTNFSAEYCLGDNQCGFLQGTAAEWCLWPAQWRREERYF